MADNEEISLHGPVDYVATNKAAAIFAINAGDFEVDFRFCMVDWVANAKLAVGQKNDGVQLVTVRI